MPITSITSEPDSLTLTLVGDYPVPVERLWAAWSDPRQLERFWGPPEWPATFTRHDLVAGGRSEYHMTGPDGSRAAGYWLIEHVDPGKRIEVVDGFAAEDGTPNEEMPTMRMELTFEPTDGGSRFVSVTTFPDLATMEQLAEMGMVEGASSALGQMDEVLADLARFAADLPVVTQLLDDTRVRISRVVRGTVEQVWRAHFEPALVQQWMLGPEGWTMPVCEISPQAGSTYRYEWAADDGSARFGFEGELLEVAAPHRAVQTERMTGTDGPGTRNELTLTPAEGGTLLTYLITYPSKELRDEILATGMTDGMESSYVRLESLLAA